MSFSQTSKEIRLESGRMLHALCRKWTDGSYVPSSLDLNPYIANIDGHLEWSWQGDYVDTTKNIELLGTYLQAECRNREGTYILSRINLDEKILNDNGVLKRQ